MPFICQTIDNIAVVPKKKIAFRNADGGKQNTTILAA